MIIHANEYGETLLTHKGGGEPLKMPITEVTDAAELMPMVSEYFDELPATFKSTVLVPGVTLCEHPCTTLENTCKVIVEMIDLMKKDPIAADNAVLVVVYDRYKQALDMVLGKLRYQLSPDTLISEQAGHA